ncbi:MAG: hypothetical protein NZM42_13965 [Gemmatales bacterium]|nr:hypothetical protein [Gemmatales bacterium]MDW8223981.1 hypothetical protein [Gemmatales bacterium]
MKRYRYVILAGNGTSHDVSSRRVFSYGTAPEQKVHALPDLLERGWRPIREIPFGGDYSMVLILLEREERYYRAPTERTSAAEQPAKPGPSEETSSADTGTTASAPASSS